MDTEHFKRALEKELALIEAELKTVGEKINPAVDDWEASEKEMDVMTPMADENESADKIEEYNEHRAINDELEARYHEVKAALERIEKRAYGTCAVCGQPTEEDRLEANPAATTCTAHMTA